jgi:hypothetical protein
MTGNRRPPRLGVLFGALALLVGVAAGVRAVGVPEKLDGSTSPAVTTTGLFGPAAGAADTRVQRHVEIGKAQQGSRLDGVGGSAARTQASQAWVTTLAAILERAGHPERVGHILLRGPPTASV